MVARGDRYMVPWLEWAYCGCADPTTAGPGNAQAIVIDPSRPPRGSNLIGPTLRTLVEPYPLLVAGTPTGWSFERSTDTFSLGFSSARAGGGGSFPGGSVTEVATPALDYPRGYAVTATGAAVVSAPAAGTLMLAACPGATRISVTVTASGGTARSCEARLRVRVWPRRFARRRATTFTLRVDAVLGRYQAPVAGATVTLDRHRVHTGVHGGARLHVRLGGRRYTLRARAAGFNPGRAQVQAR
jgi:hypothetical protein